MDLEKKDSFDLNSKKKFISWNKLPWSAKGPHFIIVTIYQPFADRGFSCTHSVWGRIPDWTLSFPNFVSPVYMVWVHHSREILISSFCHQQRPSNQSCTIWYIIYIKWTQSRTWAGMLTIKGNLNCVLHCFSGTQFRLLPESVGCPSFLLK